MPIGNRCRRQVVEPFRQDRARAAGQFNRRPLKQAQRLQERFLAPDVPLEKIFNGIWPFWLAMLACLLILVAFPGIALYLPNTMF